MLIGVEDVSVVLKDEIGDGGDDAFLVRAFDEQDCAVFQGLLRDGMRAGVFKSIIVSPQAIAGGWKSHGPPCRSSLPSP